MVKVIEFYNTGICESEPRSVARLDDSNSLISSFLNELRNLDPSEKLEIRVLEMTEIGWSMIEKYSEENC